MTAGPQSLADWIPGDLVQCCIFSKFKTGKTWGALTFPRPCVIDFDHGVKVAASPEFIAAHGDRRKAILYKEFSDPQGKMGVPTSAKGFDSACAFFDLMMTKARIDTFDTWIVDSGTTLSASALVKAMVLLGGTGFSGAKSGTFEAAKQHGLVVPKIQDYGAERSMVEQFVRMILDSGKHVVFICHEKTLTDKEGNTIEIVPLLTGKSVESVPIMFDEVYHLVAKKKKEGWVRTIRTAPSSIYKCGSRYGIPDGTEWTWDALSKAFASIRATQTKGT